MSLGEGSVKNCVPASVRVPCLRAIESLGQRHAAGYLQVDFGTATFVTKIDVG